MGAGKALTSQGRPECSLGVESLQGTTTGLELSGPGTEYGDLSPITLIADFAGHHSSCGEKSEDNAAANTESSDIVLHLAGVSKHAGLRVIGCARWKVCSSSKQLGTPWIVK